MWTPPNRWMVRKNRPYSVGALCREREKRTDQEPDQRAWPIYLARAIICAVGSVSRPLLGHRSSPRRRHRARRAKSSDAIFRRVADQWGLGDYGDRIRRHLRN